MKFRIRDYFSPLRVLRYRRLMAEAPFWTPSWLDSWAREHRAAIVRHAAATVPHYADSLRAAGIRLNRVEQDEEWRRIPTIDRSTVVSNAAAMVSRTAKGAVWASTSGSTGRPLRILLDRNINAAAFALFWRAWGTGGYWRLGQRHAVMKGPLTTGLLNVNRRICAIEVVAARINEQTVKEVRDALAGYRPRFMRGYPSSMYLFCRLLEEAGLELRIPLVVSGSETLYDYHRAKIQSVLDARVINHYTHWERVASILECEEGAMHAQEDYGHHELLDKDGTAVAPGQEGEIAVTGLHNLAMPLIRYRTGDIGVWRKEQCCCGRSFPVVDRILGREVDFLIRRDGAALSGLAVTRFMRELRDVRFVQIVQYEPGAIVVKVVQAPNYADVTTTHIIRDLRGMFDEQMDVQVQSCTLEDLERSPLGKIRQYINRIPADKRPGFAAPPAPETVVGAH